MCLRVAPGVPTIGSPVVLRLPSLCCGFHRRVGLCTPHCAPLCNPSELQGPPPWTEFLLLAGSVALLGCVVFLLFCVCCVVGCVSCLRCLCWKFPELKGQRLSLGSLTSLILFQIFKIPKTQPYFFYKVTFSAESCLHHPVLGCQGIL